MYASNDRRIGVKLRPTPSQGRTRVPNDDTGARELRFGKHGAREVWWKLSAFPKGDAVCKRLVQRADTKDLGVWITKRTATDENREVGEFHGLWALYRLINSSVMSTVSPPVYTTAARSRTTS